MLARIPAALAALSLISCAEAEPPFAPPSAASPLRAPELRMVEPRDGRAVQAGQAFLVRVEQRLRAGPVQGRGQVDLAAPDAPWQDLGPPFPWSAQGAEFSTFVVIPSPGAFRLRVRILADDRAGTFLETDPVLVYARPGSHPAPPSSPQHAPPLLESAAIYPCPG